MKDLVADIKYDASKVINQAVGPSKEFCIGYMNPGAGEGYISTMKLSVGTVDVKDLDTVTENIVTVARRMMLILVRSTCLLSLLFVD